MNKQIPIRQHLILNSVLFVNSIFHTIQGEGPFAGSPSVFVRLMGCNLQCPSCDTEYTSGAAWEVGHIVNRVRECWLDPIGWRRPLVVITGGEPFRQDISRLVSMLIDNGFKVQIETNGTLFVNLGWSMASPHLTIVCSPKTGKVNKDLLQHIDAFKYVVHADSVDFDDGLPILALDHTASPRVARPPQFFDGDIFIQPIDVKDEAENKRHLAAAMSSALRFGYRLCLQMHKIIGVE